MISHTLLHILRHRVQKPVLSLVFTSLIATSGPVSADSFYWDPDGSTSGNNEDGSNLGGSGTWDTSTGLWWDLSSLGTWSNGLEDQAIFTYDFPSLGLPVANTVTLGEPINVNRLSFLRSGYTLSGATLTLTGTTPTLHATLGDSAFISSVIAGNAGLTKTGGGTIRLADGNTYTGVTTINNGTLVITDESGLGADTSAVVVTEMNTTRSNTSTTGFSGGSLFLDGSAGGFTFSRELLLQGGGPINSRSAALMSVGNNVLSGIVNTAVGVPATPTTFRNTRIHQSNGLLELTGTLNVGGTPGTTITTLGTVNTTGVGGNFSLTGVLAGTGTLEKSGAGTLFLNPSTTAGFNGRLRISGSTTTGRQSSVRVTSADVFGTANATNASAPIDMNGGILEVRSDAGLDIGKNVYNRASSTYFFGPSIAGDGFNETNVFGSVRAAANTTMTFNSRNGFGATFGALTMESSNNNTTVTNNMGGLLTFTGDFWNNSDGSARTLSFTGSGNTRIEGSINPSGAGVKTLTKSNNGVLTLNGTASTLNGPVNISGGAVAIRDFRAVNNVGTGVINIGSGGTAGALIIGTDATPSAAGLNTGKTINLAGTTGTASIYANQTGSDPVVLNGAFTTTGGAATNNKTLVLGGTNTADNIIYGNISNQAGATSAGVSVLKIGGGTWVLAGTNTYGGTTTIANGTLKFLANGPVSTVRPAASALAFGANNGYSGGTFEFVGRDGEDNVQNLGTLSYGGSGANTIRLTPGAGGTASLTFANIGTGGGGTLNIVGADFTDNRVTFTQVNASTGSNGILTRSIYWNGADFAYREGGVMRAPVYGVDAGTSTSATALTSGSTNEITGSFSTNTISVSNLKIAGSQGLVINAGQTLTLSAGGLIATGGVSTVSGGTVALGTGALVARVDLLNDELDISSVITGSGGLTKSGAGTLILSGANTRTGTTGIEEGTVRLSGSGVLSGANATTNIRQGATLDLNGVSTGTSIGQFNNNGRVTNSSGSAATLQVGNNNGTGTSFGVIDGEGGVINVVKVGTGAQSWLGLSTYTGTTTIGGTGLVTVDVLADGGIASGIGASSSDAANLVFDGTTGGISYRGNLVNGILNLGSTSASTNRLFTVSGSGVTIASSASTNLNNAIIWSNPGAIVHGTNQDRTFIFSGSSQGDNAFNPQITDATGFSTSVTKSGTGIWRLGAANNTYSGATMITQGILMATDGGGLSSNSNLVFDGGTLYTQGSFTRNIGTGPGEMRFATPAANTAQFGGGFLGGDSKLTVNWAGTPEWGVTAGFLDSRNGLLLNGSQARAQGATGSIALSEVDLAGSFSLGSASGAAATPTVSTTSNSATINFTTGTTAGLVVGQSITGTGIASGAYIVSINSATQITVSANSSATATGVAATVIANTLRPIRVDDNGNTGADFATISGSISAGDSATGLRKLGNGVLRLSGDNSYEGETSIYQGTISASSLGISTSAPNTLTSVGVSGSTTVFSTANAITLGNGGTGGGILQYTGTGETSDRMIRLNSTTGSNQIHADGTGPLILTNVLNNMAAGNKTLLLRGTNTAGNMITSQLSDNGGTLGVQVDGSAVWILTNENNDYTGLTTVGAGALGIGHNSAIGAGELRLSNGSVFAYGGDRAISNPVSQANNTTGAFIGDYSLNFTSAYALLSTTSNPSTTTNNILGDKTLTFGGVTANAITANRTWTLEGNGTTIIDGDITSSTAFGLGISKVGNGTLVLGGTGASNFNRNNANVDLDRGTLRFIADNAIPALAGHGGLIISPDLVDEDVATLDLNGTSQTVNAFTATTNGTLVLDNTSANAASFRFGANDAAVNFGSGVGSYTIQNTGAGALDIIKTGNAAALFSAGLTLGHKGITGSEGGGSFTVGSALTATTGLRAVGNSVLALPGGLTNPGLITGIEVGGGSTLSLVDGAGSAISNLSSLSLGNTGLGTATLKLNIGDGATDSLTLLSGGAWNFGNSVTFDLTDAGLAPLTTYTLLNLVDGGLSSFGFGNLIQGATPGGFSGYTWNVTDNLVQITTGTLVSGPTYWRGLTDTTWNGNVNNWSSDKAGTTPALSIPGQASDVIFAYDGASGAVVTTLEQNFKVNSLTFEAGATTPTAVTINAGADAASRLEVVDGVSITAGGPSAVTLNAGFKIGGDQTWNVADAGTTLTLAGPLLGEGELFKTGSGNVVLSGVADATFNSGGTTNVIIDGGNFALANTAGLGVVANSNLATIRVNAGGGFYFSGAGSTTVNAITLNGGTLSAAGGTQTYSSVVNVLSDSFINMADSNGLPTATGRSITLSGGLTGTGNLTVNGNNAASGGNQITGTLTLNQDNSAWTGDWNILRGSISTNNPNGLGSGSLITAEKGRIIYAAGAGTPTLSHDLVIASATEAAVLELSLASSTPLTVTGGVTLGGAGGSGELRVVGGNDAATATLTGGVVLANDGMLSVRNATLRLMHVDSVISETGGARNLRINDAAWGGTPGTVRLTGANTFTGDVTIARGVLEFSTVTDALGAASSLGQGSDINMVSGTLSFIGSSSQSTNRAITTTGSSTLSAAGTDGASINYTGPITQALNNTLTLAGLPGSSGIISGGITQVGSAADLNVNSGQWTLTGTGSLLADDIIVTSANAVLNLNATGVIAAVNPAGTSSGLYARTGAVINLNADDVNGVGNSGGLDFVLLGDSGAGAAGILNMNGFNLSVPRLDLGQRGEGLSGQIDGTGILNVTNGAIDLFDGTVNANLASGGTTAFEKIGPGTVTLRGDNSGLGSTGATIIYQGALVLDFTVVNGASDKIRALSQLDMRGSTLRIIGNESAASSQSVASFTLANGGSSVIDMNSGTGQTSQLDLKAITRAGSAGTLRVNLNDDNASVITNTTNTAAHGLLGSSGFATVRDDTGTWFATNSTNAAGGSIVAFTSTEKNDISTWAHGDHVTDAGGGYTGTVSHSLLRSLRYDAAGGSAVTLDPTGVLTIVSGGILVTDQVTSGSPGIFNGTLASGVTELILTHDSSQTFEISADMRVNNAFTKAGAGTLILSGNNVYTGQTQLQNGTLILQGGNSIGDTSLVTIGVYRDTILQLTTDETIGRLQGGQRATNADYGTVAIGSHTLTLNHAGGSTTYSGFFTGDGNIVMSSLSTSNLNLNNVSSGFTGEVEVNGGLFQLSGIGRIDASSITVNNNGMLLIDNNSTTNSTTRILNSTPIILNSAAGGGANIRGLWVRNTDNNSSRFETIGDLVLNSGTSYLTGEANVSSGNARAGVIAENFVRNNSATISVRGRNLGTALTHHNQFRIVTANEAAFIAGMTGGGGAADSATISIVPWAIGETHNNTTTAGTNMGNSLVTYVAGAGLRPLNPATEYADIATAGDTNNTRESRSSDLTGVDGRVLNSLVIDNLATASVSLTGSGAGHALTNTSGAFLFTVTGGAASTAYGTTLGGFGDGILTPSGEYIFHVVNPSAATTTYLLTATVSSPLNSAADITKSGRGTLVLDQFNTAGGGLNKTTINEGILEITDLDNIGGNTGDLVFAGGTLRLGSTFDPLTDILSSRTISFLTGGGTLDTNGKDPVLDGSLGSGPGGFTKAGLGNLTLNAAATYTGATLINAGTITIGADNALGSGGDLTIAGGAELAFSGSNLLSQGFVTTSGASPLITGTGTINASRGFFFNHTGNTRIDAVLGGAGGLRKAQNNVLTLAGANTYTGTTEVHGGTLSFDSIGNVGSGPSALGNPGNVEDGIIRLGLTSAAVALTYTGSGHSTDRVIELQGTTGAVTFNANGTGPLGLGSVQTSTPGNKTLTLRGTADSLIENSVGAITEVGGALSLVKNDASTWVLTGTNFYTGTTTLDNGILRLDAAQDLAGALRFGSAGTITTTATLEVREDSAFGPLTVQPNGSANLIIDPARELTINGNVLIGSATASTVTNFVATGGGDFTVNSPTNTGNTFHVGGTGTSNLTLADFSELATMNVTLNTTGGTLLVSSTSGTNLTGKAELRLADTTTITANALTVGGGGNYNGNADQVNLLKLGSIANMLNVNVLNIGTGARDLGSITFQDTGGTVTVRAADGTSAAAFNMGTGSATTAVGAAGNQNLFDVTGHTADLKFSSMNFGTQNRNSDLINVFSFDTGTLEIGTLNASVKGTNGNTTTTTINIGGGTVTTGEWTLATTSGPGNAIATANFTGGDITFSGSINRGADSAGGGTATGTVNLDGATLDMGGNNIGSTTSLIVFNARSGTLSNLGELNGGGTLDKTTTGTLILDTANTYTGATTVTAGVLRVSHGGALGDTASGTTVADGAALELTGDITTSNEALTLNGSGVSDSGALRNVSGNNTYAGNITLDSATRINSDAGLLTLDATTGAAIGATDQNLTLGGAGNITVTDAVNLGAGNLVKDGAGTVILSGDNTYTGTTTVSEGLLQINGDSSLSTGAVNVASGATLGGSGTIGGVASTATIASGGILTAGSDGSSLTPGVLDPLVTDAVSTLSFGGDLTASSGSIWLVDLVQGGTSDLINVGGALDITGANLSINFGGTFVEHQVYTIANYGTGLTGNFAGLSEGAFVDPGNLYRINYGTGPSGAITLTAVPEPGTLGFLGLALGGFFVRRIRRRRAAAAPVSQGRE